MDDVLLITGGSRGIGAATARRAAERGYTVCLTYRTHRDRADAVVDEITGSGGRAYAFACDVACEADVRRVFEQMDQEAGPVSALVNNAGILNTKARFEEIGLERWRNVFEVNLFGSVLCTQEAIRRMSPRYGGSGGAIVNVSSAAARMGGAFEFTDYAATKGAMDTLTVGLAKEVAAEGIRVNGVRPGLIFTDIHADSGQPDRVQENASGVPMERGGTPEEVAQAILWLLSDAASYVTGAVLDVTGGR